MNILVLVEGEISEKYVYENWIPYVHSKITYVKNIFDIVKNHFSIISGGGYPNYFKVIKNAIDDVNQLGNIDRLVIAIDSEEMTFEEKLLEIKDVIKDKECSASIEIVIQHFCLETWALGNKRVGPRNPKSVIMRRYKEFFNVLEKDPELLPPYPANNLNRAKFAERYLRTMLNDKNKNLTYSKRNPKALLHRTYFNEVKKRFKTTGHISSFVTFLNAFSEVSNK